MHISNKIFHISNFLINDILPAFVWIFLLYGFDEIYVAHLTVISAIIHEMGHCLALSLKNKDSCNIKAKINGLRISEKEIVGYKDTIFILLSGPMTNLFVFLILAPFSKEPYIRLLQTTNLLTALSNLLPVDGFDGYEALKATLQYFNLVGAVEALDKISFIFIIFCVFFSLYFINKTDGGYWFFALFFLLSLTNIKKMLQTDYFGE